jgi:hypothetical protein
MRNFKKISFLFLAFVIIQACQKSKTSKYEVNPINSYGDNLNKNKAKSNIEYHSILSTNLFQKPSSVNELTRLDRVIQSCGDKSLINEVIISNYMNSSQVRLPSRKMMTDSTDKFIDQTFIRFYIRRPSEAEKTWFTNFINANKSNPNFTPELVYTAFAASDEYFFY